MPNRPVIFGNLASEWPASKKWDVHYFRSKIRDNLVQIAVLPDGLADAVVEGKFQLPEERTMKFSDFLDIISGDVLPDDKGVYYLQRQNSCLTEEYQDLAIDVPKEIGLANLAFNSSPDAINIWIGGQGSVSSLHRDPYENIYTVIRGTKIFKLFPPTARGKITYKEFPVVRYKYDNGWITVKEPGIETVRWIENGVAGVDHPPIIVKVEPGETLYLPAGWFHQDLFCQLKSKFQG